MNGGIMERNLPVTPWRVLVPASPFAALFIAGSVLGFFGNRTK